MTEKAVSPIHSLAAGHHRRHPIMTCSASLVSWFLSTLLLHSCYDLQGTYTPVSSPGKYIEINSSGNLTTLFLPDDCPAGLTWQSSNFGTSSTTAPNPTISGSYTALSNNSFSITGYGNDFYTTGPGSPGQLQGQFIYQTFTTGSATLTAYIPYMPGSGNQYASFGLMTTASLSDPVSTNTGAISFLPNYPELNINLFNNAAVEVNPDSVSSVWLRLGISTTTSSPVTISVGWSNDGSTWTTYTGSLPSGSSSYPSSSNPLYVGMYVTSHNNVAGGGMTVTFSNVSYVTGS
jgi:hypothetical protein